MIVAIGKPNELVRMFCIVVDTDEANIQCKTDEVWCEVAAVINGGAIMREGLVEPAPINSDRALLEAWAKVKMRRNALLNDCIWTVGADSPLTTENKQEWLEYRKSLHKITVEFSSPESVVWPTEPTYEYE